MALIAEVEQFITDAGLNAEEAQQMRAIFEKNTGAQEKVKGSVLRQSDYSKHMDGVRAAQADLEKKKTDLDAEFARVSAHSTDADQKVLNAQRAVESAESKLTKATNRLKRAVEIYGMPEDEVKDLIAEVTTPAKETVAPDPDDAPLTMRQFKEQAIAFGNQMAMLPAVQQKIAVDHFNLFGKFPEDMMEVVQAAIKSGRKLDDYAAEHYKFAEKRAELNDSKIEAKYKDKFDKELERRLSEAHLPTSTRPAPPGSRILNIPRPAAAATTATTTATATATVPARSERTNSVHNRISTVNKAVNAFREGKYAAK